MNINIDVIGQNLICNKREKKFVAGTQEFISFVFNLDDSWKGLLTFAQFIQNDTAYNVYLDEDNRAYLPSEIVSGACVVCLQGNKDNVIAKSIPLFFTVYPDPVQSGASGTVISLTLYDQLAAKVANIETENAIIRGEYAEMLERIEYAEAAALAANVKNFKDVQHIVRAGLASKAYAVGDQLVCQKETSITISIGDSKGVKSATIDADTFINKMGASEKGVYEATFDGAAWHKEDGTSVLLSEYGITITGTPVAGDHLVITENATVLVWDIIGIDVDTPADSQFKHSMTLQLHDCYTTAMSDQSEYMFVAAQELPAGTYHFKVNHCGYGNVTTQDTTTGYQFTTTKAIPAGGFIKHSALGVYRSDNTYTVANALTGTFTTYNADNTTLESGLTTSEGEGGTYLGTLTARDPQYRVVTDYGEVNFTERQGQGSNNWSKSAIRQWINSNAAGNAWWTAKSVFDRSPSNASSAGFLNGIDPDFLSVIGNVVKRTALHMADGGGYEDAEERFFLLSMTETFCGNNGSVAEGTAYPFYADYSDYSSPNSGADSNRIKYKSGSAQYWWLRSPYTSYAYTVRYIFPTGQLYVSSASSSYGVAPACSII